MEVYHGREEFNLYRLSDGLPADVTVLVYTAHTVVDIKGKERVEGITLAEVDSKGKPIPGTEEEYSCDTLLLSVGLIPEYLSQGSH